MNAKDHKYKLIGARIAQHLKEQTRERFQPVRENGFSYCSCKEPFKLRMYLGYWLCVCGKLIDKT